LGAAGETETTQKNIQDWLERAEEDPGFQLLTEKEIAAVIFVFIFISTTLLHFPFICFLSVFLLGLSFSSLIRIIA
jgi:hypothetical protein